MGSNGVVPGVSVLQTFCCADGQQSLTYIMTTPNLDAVGHRWVSALARFDFKIEYLKGSDNKVADVLSHVETRLDNATTKEFLADGPNTILKGAGYMLRWMRILMPGP